MHSEGYGTCVLCLWTTILVLQATTWRMSDINSFSATIARKNGGSPETTMLELKKLVVSLTRLLHSPSISIEHAYMI